MGKYHSRFNIFNHSPQVKVFQLILFVLLSLQLLWSWITFPKWNSFILIYLPHHKLYLRCVPIRALSKQCSRSAYTEVYFYLDNLRQGWNYYICLTNMFTVRFINIFKHTPNLNYINRRGYQTHGKIFTKTFYKMLTKHLFQLQL